MSLERFWPCQCDLGVAARRRVGRRTVLGLEALVRRPRLQQRPVDGEVLARDVAAQLGLADDRGEEPIRDLGFQQPVAVLGERRRVERLGVDRQVQEPLEQQVVVQPLAERPLAAHRVQRHQHRRLEQLLGRDARPTDPRVHRVELAVELAQDLVDDPADPPDRVILRDQILGAQRREHRQLLFGLASHPHRLPNTTRGSASTYREFFSTLLTEAL